MPRLTTVRGAKQRSIFDARVNSVWIVERRFKMPDSFELPRMWSAIVKLMRGERFSGLFRSVVNKLIALAHRHSFGRHNRRAGRCSRLEPRLAAVVGALNDLSEPAARLRSVNAIWVRG